MPTLAEVLAQETRTGDLFVVLPDGRRQCVACGHCCPLPDGAIGVCKVRFNQGGRLLVPVTPAQGAGGMLLVTRTPADRFDARFVCRALFIPCAGARDEETARRLTEAFKREEFKDVKSLRRNTPPDDTCWCAGPSWWLSTAGNP